MNDKDNGGPAFPTENERQTGHSTWHYEGMTLRDYFAIHSVQPGTGELASLAGLIYRNGAVWKDEQTRVAGAEEWFNALPLSERLALFSRVKYAMADAMLKARQS